MMPRPLDDLTALRRSLAEVVAIGENLVGERDRLRARLAKVEKALLDEIDGDSHLHDTTLSMLIGIARGES